jgi:hypothetical protein
MNFQQLAEEFDNYDIFVRAQNESHTLEEMQAHRSFHGYDDEGEEIFVDGICASDRLGETGFGGAGMLDTIVFLRGQRVEEIYDGVVIYPTEIVCEMNASEYEKFLQSL